MDKKYKLINCELMSKDLGIPIDLINIYTVEEDTEIDIKNDDDIFKKTSLYDIASKIEDNPKNYEIIKVCLKCPIGKLSKKINEDSNINYILKNKLSKESQRFVADQLSKKIAKQIYEEIIFGIIGKDD